MVRRAAALVLLVIVAGAAPTVVAADVRGEPDLSLSLGDATVTPGEEATLRVTVQNAGIIHDGSARNPSAEQRVTTARAIAIDPRAGNAPVQVETGTIGVGSLQDGASRTVDVRVSVDRDADPGSYDLPVRLAYTHTRRISGNDSADHDERTVERTVDLEVDVEPAARFAVVNTSTSAPIGGAGTVAVAVRNVGEDPATDATVTVSSPNAGLTFGGAGSAGTFVGTWPAGETRLLTYEASVAPGTERRRLAVAATVAYDDDRGRPRSAELSTGVVPPGEQSFVLRDVEADLRVGETGTLAADLDNVGPATAENAVLVAEPRGPTVDLVETDYPVGTIGPNESATVRYRVEPSSAAIEGPRQFQFHVEYTDDDGETVRSGPLYARAAVAPERPVFRLRPVDTRVAAGSAQTLRVEVTNARDETLTDVTGKLFPESPLGSSDDEAFVDALEPGESTVLQFRVSASGSAATKTYPLSLDFQYDDGDGDTRVSDTYKLPIEVTESRGGGFLWLAPFGGLGAGLVAIAAFFLYRR